MTATPNATTRRPTRFRRTLLSMRWWHNWLSVFMGLLLVLWVVSGLIMLLPVSDIAKSAMFPVPTPVNWQDIAISPSQAASAALASAEGTVRTVEFKRFPNSVAYLVRLSPTGTVLVDGRSGAMVTVTDSLAGAIAAHGLPGGTASIGRIERVESAGDHSGHGPLPAWRVIFTDAARTEAWVHIATGDMRRSTASDRWKTAWGHNAHVFSALGDAPGGNTSRLGALWITSIISLIAMVAGYWLALPARWRSKVRI